MTDTPGPTQLTQPDGVAKETPGEARPSPCPADRGAAAGAALASASRCPVIPRRKQLGRGPPAGQVACFLGDGHRPRPPGPSPAHGPLQGSLRDWEGARSAAAPPAPGRLQTAASCHQHFTGRGMFWTFIFSEGAGRLGLAGRRAQAPGVPGAPLLSDVASSVTRRASCGRRLRSCCGGSWWLRGVGNSGGSGEAAGGAGVPGGVQGRGRCQSRAAEGGRGPTAPRHSLVSGALPASEPQGPRRGRHLRDLRVPVPGAAAGGRQPV